MQGSVKLLIRVLGLAAMAGLASGGALAQDGDKDLGAHKKWHAHAYQEAGAPVCNMYSQPGKHEEGGRPRGNIYAYVTHRPKSKRFGEVSFDMGYPLKPGSDVTVSIGKQSFKLFVKDNAAFARTEDDPKLVKAMRRGNTMVVRGVSTRGTKTTDTYSLSGFTKAHKAINKECGGR